MSHIVLVNPRFEKSYWGLEYALPLVGKKANLPTACLPLLASLTPAEHQVTLVDENVQAIDFDMLARADIVGLTGMSVQRKRMREILVELKRRNVFTVVGGPWVTVHEEYFGNLADVVFIGEAETTWPEFLKAKQSTSHRSRYEQPSKTDMSGVPAPRYDLLDMKQYLFGSIQISRGCPFQCEFCDIIVTFGRRPRLKATSQVIVELELLRTQKMEIAFIVDDNLIGNKQLIKPILREVAQWQVSRGFPLTFFAEASLDLADDPELMELMVACNIQAIFVGIESPREESLQETRKFQNLRASGTMIEKIRRIQQAGMEVWTGMIVGFDNDDETIFDHQSKFVQEARVIHVMLGMLTAIPKTPLYDRLLKASRLDLADTSEFGTNILPLRLSRQALRDGYMQTMKELNSVEAFFDRTDSLYLDRHFQFDKARQAYWRTHHLAWAVYQAKTLSRCAVLYWRLMKQVKEPLLRSEYRKRILRLWKKRRETAALFVYILKCATHYHYMKLSKDMFREDLGVTNTF
jgi:radical SAM superfamily enzyme YgiQ (UPF0313 family)